MRILLALDSRVANKGCFALLDLGAGQMKVHCHDFAEDFKRLGFRGFALHDNTAYVLNSAALYLFKINFSDDTRPLAEHLKTVTRPEWQLGERSAADLHHVHFSESRRKVFVANSFMDCVEEVSPDGVWLRRKYLWDISPSVLDFASQRNPVAADLTHINYIAEHRGKLYLTLGNINGTRKGAVIRYETGEVVLDGLDFPHDGLIVDDCLYVSNSDTSLVYIYEGLQDYNLFGIEPTHILPVEIRQDVWKHGGQWLRGMGLTTKYLIVGATQLRADLEGIEANLVPSRLVFFDRETKRFIGEVFLPVLEDFPNPCIYCFYVLGDDEDVDFAAWETKVPDHRTSQLVSIDLPDSALRQYDQDEGRFQHWSWDRSDGAIGVKIESDGTVFVCDFEDVRDKRYLLSGSGSGVLTNPDDRPELYRIMPGAATCVRIEVLHISPFAQLSVFVGEFDDFERLEMASQAAKEGRNPLKFKTNERTKSYRIGLRFSGRGSIKLGRISVEQVQPADRAQA